MSVAIAKAWVIAVSDDERAFIMPAVLAGDLVIVQVSPENEMLDSGWTLVSTSMSCRQYQRIAMADDAGRVVSLKAPLLHS